MRTGTGARPARTVGLDKPCEICGKPVYYNYKSPVEGLCGRCADQVRRRRDPRYPRLHRPGRRRSRWPLLAALALTVLVGAALALLLGPYLGLF